MGKFTLVLIALYGCVAVCLAQSCGQSKVPIRASRLYDPSGRIVGGVETRPNSLPWTISLQQYGSHFCGGTLIRVSDKEERSDIIITAAHCVYEGTKELTATAGAHDYLLDYKNVQIVKAVNTVYHPQYDPKSTINDIAIVKLEKPINFTDVAQPACLPSPGEMLADMTSALVAGWGLTRENGPGAFLLNQVSVPIMAHQRCAPLYAKQGVMIDEKAMICAGYNMGGKDACQGDSGGPFIVTTGGKSVLQGVVSFGVGCARAGSPGVYARVSNYIGWINQQIKAQSSLVK